jgi:hypothetical protein
MLKEFKEFALRGSVIDMSVYHYWRGLWSHSQLSRQ